MVHRVRTRYQDPVNVGFKISYGGAPCTATYYYQYTNNGKETCTDEVLSGDGHPFDVTRRRWEGDMAEVLNKNCSGQTAEFIKNFVPSSLGGDLESGVYSGHLNIVSRPSDGALAAELLAKTNPSRSVVDLPIFVFELRELPQLFKGYGDNWLRNVANGNLSYQFGIKPLISDLQSLLNFSDEFEKRAREIERLAEGGLRRKLPLWNGSTSSTSSPIGTESSSWGSTVHVITRVTTEQCSGFTRWVPTGGMPKTSAERRALARKAVLGMTIDFSTAWNAMPWSWLIDWCSSMGDFLSAQRNIIPCQAIDTCIVGKKTTEATWKRTGGTFPRTSGSIIIKNIGDYRVTTESKYRNPASPTVSAHLPGLSLRQLSILGSIGIKKYRF